MAPTRKAKSVNKQYSSIYEISPDKDAGNSRKSKPKKIAGKLGSQWSKAEIERFYKAYRKYGKDWKKVAAAVRNRSTEMVEALYNMNRAYLSLPDGTASVIGLIAMMSDHYNVLGDSDGERESNELYETPKKAQKHKQTKVHLGSSKEDVLEPRTIASSQEYLSLLKSPGLTGIHPHPTRKRTPRVPVSYSYRKADSESYNPPNKRVKKSEVDDNDDKHVAALTLTGALQSVSSPQVSQRTYRKAECRKSSPVQSYDRMLPQSETTKAKLCNSSFECFTEGRLGGSEPVTGTYASDTCPLMDMKGVGTGTNTIEAYQKGKKFYRQKVKVEENMNSLSDDGVEACNGTEEGIVDSALKGKVDMEIPSAKSEVSPWSQRKRSKKLVFEDESSSLDALLTLANLSTSMLPTSITDSESSVKSKEDRITRETREKSSVPEAAPLSHHTDKIKHLEPKEKVVNLINGSEDGTSRKSKVWRYSAMDDKVVSGPKQQPKPTNNLPKRKHKSFSTEISNSEALMDSPLRQSFDNKDMAEEENINLTKGKCGTQSSVKAKQCKSFRVPEDSLTNNDSKMGGIDSDVSQVPAPNSVGLPNKHQNTHKANVLLSTDVNSSKYTLKDQPNKHSLSQDRLKENLSSCLSSKLARRWCCFEWFYSAIDYAWFAKREFVEYLNHVGLGNVPRLTHVEWGVLRSSLGKPRRFSECFLHEEREKLEQYRESVRQHYTQLRNGTREGLPTDLAHPISVGQQVIAIHPKTREVHDGKVLMVDHDSCRVQFDSPELGVEIVMDIDCMPCNPLENMPETLRRQNLALDEFSVTPNESPINGHLDFGGSVVFTSSGHAENATSSMNMLTNPIKADANHNILHAKTAVPNVVSAHQTAYGQPHTMAHIQGREADIRDASKLNRALDKMEDLSMELRNTNNGISENRNGESCIKGSERFKKHTATASSASRNLRQRNAHPANTRLPQQKPPISSNFFGGMARPVLESEPGSVVSVIVRGSRLKAQSVVDAAIKAMSSKKEGENPFMRIVEALNSVNIWPENGCFSYDNNWNPKLEEASENTDEQAPSELITSCVATLLMIKTCTEEPYRLGDLAQIIDAAVTSLHPCCSRNLPIYQQIQMCMGRIKTLILAYRRTGV